MRWLSGLILGAVYASGEAWADVRLTSNLGSWSIGACDTPHYGQFELGDSISSSCSDTEGDTHSASIQESSRVVTGSHGVDLITMSASIAAQANYDEAGGSLRLSCGLEATSPTPFVLNIQPNVGGSQAQGRVKIEWDGLSGLGCDCVGSDCAEFGCDPGQGSLVLQGVLRRGISTLIVDMNVRVYDESGQGASGTAALAFNISFNRTSTTYNWSNLTGGDFGVDANWDPRGVPTHDAQVSDTAIFGPGLYNVNVVGAKAGRFVIRQADVGLVGDAQVFESAAFPASLELEGDGSLQLFGGSSLRGVHAAVGTGAAANPGDFAAIFMDDAATQLVLSGDLSVGVDMSGLVAVDGGFLEAADVQLGGAASGKLEVHGDGADALFHDITVGGSRGLGSLRVVDGGEATAREVRIGENTLTDAQTGDTNNVLVANLGLGGRPARLTINDDLLVGVNGNAKLWVLNGSLVEAGAVTAGVDHAGAIYVRSQDPTQPATLRAAQLQIGEDNPGSLTIDPGGLVEASNVRLNFGGQGGRGELTVDGEGQSNAARMKVTQELLVGGNAQADPILVKNGGILTARTATIGNDPLLTDETIVHVGTAGGGATAPAEFNIADPNSNPLTGGGGMIVGGAGPGRLDVADGAILRITGGGLVIGDHAEGAVGVDNLGSAAGLRSTAILSGLTLVGANEAGELTVSNGGLVTTDSDIWAAHAGPGEIRVFNAPGFTGDRAELRMLGSKLVIGFYESGKLDVHGGGLVGCAQLVVGHDDITATGEASVETGGEIHCLGDMLVGASSTGAGSVVVGSASTLIVDGVLTVGGTSEGEIALTDATARVSAGILSGASTFVNNHGSIVGVGTLATTHLVIAPGGFVSPGLSPGTLTIDGDYEQQDGATLVIEVAGTQPGDFDVLHVTGDALLAGAVKLRFINGFVPQRGMAVDFLVVDGSISGALSGDVQVDVLDSSAATVAVADLAWELTSEGTYHLVVTDVHPADGNASDSPSADSDDDIKATGCGAGLCGAGTVPLLPFTLVGLRIMRLGRKRRDGR
ncbi:MAG: hypothetical protein IT450_09600 [Phycisphaerales bacterium]|nr:hypothetical protein [Phycisphaerales bacterium]